MSIRLLGITGAPGVGQDHAVAASLGLPVVPMDGFHYADVELVRRGLLDRKGAPDTFDAEGYAALLARVRRGEPDVVAPVFERDLEQPIAGALWIPPSGTVVTEGNYLLLDEPRWRAVRAQLDAVWHLVIDEAVRVERLVARHVRVRQVARGGAGLGRPGWTSRTPRWSRRPRARGPGRRPQLLGAGSAANSPGVSPVTARKSRPKCAWSA